MVGPPTADGSRSRAPDSVARYGTAGCRYTVVLEKCTTALSLQSTIEHNIRVGISENLHVLPPPEWLSRQISRAQIRRVRSSYNHLPSPSSDPGYRSEGGDGTKYTTKVFDKKKQMHPNSIVLN
ncbi:hypothetical protein EVAR_8051_1 [Eumeta japonica]|uniref:Uncharacterized protein n=1 Tax=Eumeta variegata TaxID=151549 RepID=A0A4C1TJS3_EUMVA|nr:hypothetical protein EVAR_8051_1 [Eumeta japonica]